MDFLLSGGLVFFGIAALLLALDRGDLKLKKEVHRAQAEAYKAKYEHQQEENDYLIDELEEAHDELERCDADGAVLSRLNRRLRAHKDKDNPNESGLREGLEETEAHRDDSG